MSEVMALADLGDGEFRTLMLLAHHANEQTGRCFPSVARLAEETGTDRRTVQRRLRALEQHGHLERIAHQEGGRGYATDYRLRLKGGTTAALLPLNSDTPVALSESQRAAPVTERAAIRALKGGASAAPTEKNRERTEKQQQQEATLPVPVELLRFNATLQDFAGYTP